MTVITLGRLPIAKFGNFAVIGFRVGFEVFLVAVAAVFGDGHPARSSVWLGDIVRRMTIAAYGGIGITAADFLAMHGRHVSIQDFCMTLATDHGYLQTIFRVGVTVYRGNVMSIVTVVAGRVST